MAGGNAASCCLPAAGRPGLDACLFAPPRRGLWVSRVPSPAPHAHSAFPLVLGRSRRPSGARWRPAHVAWMRRFDVAATRRASRASRRPRSGRTCRRPSAPGSWRAPRAGSAVAPDDRAEDRQPRPGRGKQSETTRLNPRRAKDRACVRLRLRCLARAGGRVRAAAGGRERNGRAWPSRGGEGFAGRWTADEELEAQIRGGMGDVQPREGACRRSRAPPLSAVLFDHHWQRTSSSARDIGANVLCGKCRGFGIHCGRKECLGAGLSHRHGLPSARLERVSVECRRKDNRCEHPH